MFKPILAVLSLAILLTFDANPVKAAEMDKGAQLRQEAKAMIKTFAMALGGHLKTAMEEGGPAHAIPFCKIKAPKVSDSLSAEGWTVARTSLKERNPDNAPTEWQRTILMDFDAKSKAGADPKTLSFAETVMVGENEVFRFMKAIPTQKVCLTCHGETIDARVVQTLDQLYPGDRARGYKAGDIRGAFVLTRTLN